jgi:carboxyl-terminal processing protease
MKVRKPLFFSVIFIAVLSMLAFLPQNDPTEKEQLLLRTILGIAESYHFSPEDINDEYSLKVYDLYLDRMDGGRRWLTQEDIKKMEAYKYKIDDQIHNGNFDFFDLSVELIEDGINRSQGFYQDILAGDFNFNIDESVEFDTDKKGFALNDDDLKEQWRKGLKYEVMTRYLDKVEEREKADDDAEIKSKTDDELIQESKEAVLKIYDRWYNRMSKTRRENRLTTYLNAMVNVFDPHTVYFEPIQKENFDIGFKGSLQGIGARLREDGDFTKVAEIIVGGPAWKGKELEAEDVIMKVAQGDEEEKLDIKGMRVDDVVQYIRGEPGTKVRLTVKKPDGVVKEISIIRDVVVLDARFAKSLLLETEEAQQIGYVHLPGFYADFNDKNGRFSAADVSKEIEKLKKDNVEGIILDLRNNPGGSLDEVRKMSGLFIEDGPVVQVKSRGAKPEVLRDSDKRVQYDGPLVVLINNFSASASEILAAALQDYKRAVIVGSTSSYGKGTVQRFIDLDRMVRSNNELKPLGQLKLTMQKYYGIDGGSVQLRGVVPDIILPDMYHFVEVGERDYEYAMEWSDIPAVKYDQKVYPIKNIEELRGRSEARVDNDATFQHVLEHAQWVKGQRDITSYPLSITAYEAFDDKRTEESKQFEEVFDKEVLTAVRNLTADEAGLKEADESKTARNEDFIKGVKKDIHLKEALSIMADMIETHDVAMGGKMEKQ